MSDEETITIKKSDYHRLKRNSIYLSALRGAGVDNWEGYDYANDSYRETMKTSPYRDAEDEDDD